MTTEYTKQKVDWVVYLERERFLFYVSAYKDPYGTLLKKATGFGFAHQFHTYSEGIGTFYRSKKELNKANEYYLKLIENKDPRIKKWHAQGIQWLKREKQLVKLATTMTTKEIQQKYGELVKDFYKILLYVTVIPFRILDAIETTKKKERFQEVIDLFLPFRKRGGESLNLFLIKLFKLAAKQTKSKYLDFSFFTPEELGCVFKNKPYPSKEEIEKRKRWCGFYEKREKRKLFFVYDKKFLEKLGIKKVGYTKTREIKGKVACPGKAKGRVKIINTERDMYKFQEGDIIVSINTTPSMIAILKKCAAIVTNDGGITCHASIISRELNKPCIIGTKIATKVLKDGDLIEVDANKGVIKRL